MDSIRPDEDELRAREPIAGKGGKPKPTRPADDSKRSAGGRGGAPGGTGRGKAPSGPGRGMVWLLVVLLVIAVAGGSWFGWQMQQRLVAMEDQLEEADYWSRQSKLALARFEGELSETGENLEETGSSMEERLEGVVSSLEEANSEIGKLWELADGTNRPQIESLVEQQEALKDRLDQVAESLSATGESVTAVRGELETLTGSVEQAGQRQQDLASAVQSMESRLGDVDERLTSLANGMEDVDDVVSRQLTRFRQEQSLTLEGLESRIQSLESGDGRVAELSRQLSATRSRLNEAEQTLQSVDASRAQLTSRLIRLQQQVDQLRAQ
ncbi:hypothetical protein MLC59_11810 [Marinobacter bryozoorum]|uniref:hypothetical protein n=1 Tax=Marinobacter bryozoorum TaxID=256324 RepID=UPI0020044F1A|nr:hypothetical protein [Marinobacter bryozoorum]MCK7544849.1 hypothetical protein [Marinobacter bryozoorum]